MQKVKDRSMKARVIVWLIEYEPIITAVVVVLVGMALVGAVERANP